MLRNQPKRDRVFTGVVRRMQLKPQAKQNKYERDQSYIKNNLMFVNLSFNRKKPDDMILYEWLEGVCESKVSYVKRLIREDMERHT